ncbi:MAG: hypothetical protein IKN47_03910 [Lachnospiraceae bacterium]|nr:hypothetical protein [Lachnospiraceae bacterium]
MDNYFEITDHMDLYEEMSDHKKGVVDGFIMLYEFFEEDLETFSSDALEEYIEEYLEDMSNDPPKDIQTAEQCAERLARDFLLYYEEIAFDSLKDDYIMRIAKFKGMEIDVIDLDPDTPDTANYKAIEDEYATGMMFYSSAQIKLRTELYDHQMGIIDAYIHIFTDLNLSIRSDLKADDSVAIEGVNMEIYQVLSDEIELPLPINTPIPIDIYEQIYSCFLSSELMNCCEGHITEKCETAYMYFVSRFAGLPYEEVSEAYM